MMSYGKDKGSRAPVAPVKTVPPLSEAGRAKAAQLKAEFEEHFPGDDMTRRLYEAGLIDGWRNLESVTVLEDDNGTT